MVNGRDRVFNGKMIPDGRRSMEISIIILMANGEIIKAMVIVRFFIH